ncbi:hypothetical protein GCM10010300_86750 [Streptomyces olivaceoviridis]|nr:hypothetical protein GCM10010300_86750 [Streptomyces olivaceoviridis]
MRYAQGGGLTDAGRAARERIRLQAVERFERGEKTKDIAAALRVSERSMERWRKSWRERGGAGSCRRARRAVRGWGRLRWSGWSGSWSVVRLRMGGRISGGPW